MNLNINMVVIDAGMLHQYHHVISIFTLFNKCILNVKVAVSINLHSISIYSDSVLFVIL